jgi:outer membrane protein assembly factor BamB
MDRDLLDSADVVRCISTSTGEQIWEQFFPAPGQLDYGNSGRATPVINGEFVYTLGAFGHLNCYKLADGDIVWSKDFLAEFGAETPTWGFSSSLLLVDGKIIANPGQPTASIVAFDAKTGEIVWKTPGGPPGYSSFISATAGGVKQVIGYDQESLGGWNLKNGSRLWTYKPPAEGDFNVPTPIFHQGKLIVATENNGTRLFDFDKNGLLIQKPLATCIDLQPDSHSPVAIGGRLFGTCSGLFCLDIQSGLKTAWIAEDNVFSQYTSIVGDTDRVLVITLDANLVLLDAKGTQPKILSQTKLRDDGTEIHSHPAFVDDSMIVRLGATLCRISLTDRK